MSIGQDRTQRLERTNGILRYSNGEMASPAEQVWEAVGADLGHDPFGGELLQLDVATQWLW